LGNTITFITSCTINQPDLQIHNKPEPDERLENGNKRVAKRNEPQKMMAVQKKAMETNMKYMMHSFRPMIFTFIPIIIIFGWMSAHFAYYPIMPDQEFTATLNFEDTFEGEMTLVAPEGIEILNGAVQQPEVNNAVWQLKGEEGSYLLEFQHDDQSYTKEVIITTEKEFTTPIKPVKDGNVRSITINNEPVKILNVYIKGWKLGWVGTYIVFSIIFSMLIRKWLKIY